MTINEMKEYLQLCLKGEETIPERQRILEKKLKIFGKGSKERILYLGNSNVVQLCQMYLTYNNTCKKNEYFF